MSSRRGVIAPLGVLLALAGCSSVGSAADDGSGSNDPETVTVFAAASLTDAFGEIASAFDEDGNNVDVEFNFLASSDLAAQIIEGAPADVFASADEANMTRIIDEGLAEDAVVLAENRFAIAVPSGNPEGISSLSDLEDPELVVALCNEVCPAGGFALEIFEAASVTVEPASLEADVRGVLTRVGLGEADAGLVYVTDIAADPAVEGVAIPDEHNAVATYPIAALEGAPPEAAEFLDYVRSESGRRILGEYGFQLP